MRRTFTVKVWVIGLLGFILGALGGFLEPQAGWARSPSVEVRRVGLSKVGENTLLTVVLDRALEPRITPRTTSGKPQLVVEFPQARAGRLPARLQGDDLLVEQVLTEVSPAAGVRITLEMFPDQPYNFWKQAQKGAGGQSFFILGIKPDTAAPRAERTRVPEAPVTAQSLQIPEPAPLEPAREDYGYKEPRGSATPGSFAELQQLIPQAASLLQGLEKDGWVVSEFHQYDNPGQRLSRDFTLTNRLYPEMAVKIAYLPANTPSTPNISIISLSTENLGGETASKYRSLRQWNFAKIKQNYEDIGDFFDDALKPLRVKLREETKSLALRQAAVFQNFLQRACPRNPQVAERVMSRIKEKVNPRFEGVQFTISEDPLVLLNLVDFLYVRVYFMGPA